MTGQNIVNGTAQVELMLAAQHRGHGHGTDALDTLVDLAFGELPMHRLTAETHTGNAAPTRRPAGGRRCCGPGTFLP
ncbi:GNAT family N-acetyltransferase [Streptomyces atratus]|uniref:GNAT family N-acetyltransferase n=1 Tax=Streptomyces atratus TaxID=1893 RepID=UPI00210D2BDB|nr:GNAT family protein [Streptomyces atratus]